MGGLAHLMEHLLVSIPLRGGLTFCERVERLGGQVNADTGLEQMNFYARVHADDAEEVAGLLYDAVLRPDLTQQRLDAEREVVLQELAGCAADPSDTVQDAILAALFRGHPLGRPVGGTPQDVQAVDVAAVREHHASIFLARRAAMVAIGPQALKTQPDMDGQRQADIGTVPLGAADSLPPTWPDGYSWACFGARSPESGHARRPAYRILAELLGGNTSSLLYHQLRMVRGLAYSFHSWDRGYTEAGAWRLMVGVAEGNGAEIAAIVRSLLADIAAGRLLSEDLHAARRQAEMRLVLNSEDPMELAQSLASRTRFGTREWSIEQAIASLQDVSVDAVARAAADVLAGLVTVTRSAA